MKRTIEGRWVNNFYHVTIQPPIKSEDWLLRQRVVTTISDVLGPSKIIPFGNGNSYISENPGWENLRIRLDKDGDEIVVSIPHYQGNKDDRPFLVLVANNLLTQLNSITKDHHESILPTHVRY